MSAFRTATWPGLALKPRPISAQEFRLGDGGALLGVPDSYKQVTLPDELFLRELMDLDLASDEQVLEFVNRYGMLSTWLPRHRWGTFEQLLLPYADFEMLQETQRAQSRAVASMAEMQLESLDTVHGFRLMAEMLRNVTRIWLAVREVMPWETMFSEWEVGLLTRPRDEGVAARVLTSLLNWGLTPFHVEVSVSPVDAGTDDENPFKYGFLPSTFSTICLQIANHMTEGATYHQCRNETCGRFFYRQRGRAEYGQYRTGGLKYCSASCARTQSSRDSRRRAKEGRESGQS